MSAKLSASGVVIKAAPTQVIGRSERMRAEILNAAFRFLWSRPFRDMTVNNLMESLLVILESDILEGTNPWLCDEGDPVELLYESLAAEVHICYRCGPFLKAVTDAAGTDARVEAGWYGMLDRFDNAVSERVVADQELGLIESFDPRPVATTLNQVNASMYVRAFGQRPRGRPERVLDAISRIWISSLYGQRWVSSRKSTLYRQQGTTAP